MEQTTSIRRNGVSWDLSGRPRGVETCIDGRIGIEIPIHAQLKYVFRDGAL